MSIVWSSPYTLEILNIDEVGTYNRIKYAYPGIEYNVVIAAFGGTAPFQWELTQSPSGMEISSEGEITWSSPSLSDSGATVEVKVTDDDGNTDTESYSVTVTDNTDRFLFVDSGSASGGNGSISNPYHDLDEFWTDNTGNKLVYLRGGAHYYPTQNGSISTRYTDRIIIGSDDPKAFIGYPGEDAILDGQSDGGSGYCFAPGDSHNCYFSNITFTNNYYYGIVWWGGDYGTVYDCTFENIYAGTEHANKAYINTMSSSPDTTNMVLSHNDYLEVAEPSATEKTMSAVETYDVSNSAWQHSLVDMNSTRGFFFKSQNTNVAVRHNHMKNLRDQGVYVYGAGIIDGIISFNFFDNVRIEFYSTTSPSYEYNQDDIYIYRNTFLTAPKFKGTYDRSEITYQADFLTWDHNVVQNSNSDSGTVGSDREFYRDRIYYKSINSTEYNRISGGMSNDLRGASGIVDSNGNLTESYSSYIGTHGWQINATEAASPVGSFSIGVGGGNLGLSDTGTGSMTIQ